MSRLKTLLLLSLLHRQLVQIAESADDHDLRELAAYVARLLKAKAR